jgi:CHAT domain-containing protein
LPGTQDEVDLVARTLRSAGWQVQTLTGDAARKEAVLHQIGPRVLHLATHGFFVSTSSLQRDNQGRQSNLDEMLQSGLFFAGANLTLSGGAPIPGHENGILTSYEVAQLNLEGAELVVLSACETARGQQGDNGEGVFGLRRALQEAGANAILMSSWSVPDRETQELMALFYQKWLAGADKHEALRQAQLEERAAVRQRYGKDSPFYWGAFVLVGR